MNRRTFLKIGAAATVTAAIGDRLPAAVAGGLPEASAHKLPRWRGFNLLEKFTAPESRPFVEQDFEWLASWGFNFVRLPMDYRCWAKTPESEFHEPALLDIDQAVAWGKQYGVHVNLNFHHAPGYCVNIPKDQVTLWTDPAAQAQFARHWGVFARRYKGVPARRLSFDLVNEPGDVANAVYAAVMGQAVAAIRAEDPGRLIIADGTRWGTQPVPELIPLGIAQSTRGYEPAVVSHYRASWVHGSESYPLPTWPVAVGVNAHLFGDMKPASKSPLVLRVSCPQATPCSVRVAHVSVRAELLVRADGAVVLRKLLAPAAGEGEWKKSALTQWGSYAADYDLACEATLPAGTREVRIELGQGDWLTFSELRVGAATIRPSDSNWGAKQEEFTLDAQGRLQAAHPRFVHSRETLRAKMIEPWKQLAAQGVGVHVGEWGVFQYTPHDVALAWMRDCLENWKEAGWGWSLWNLRGGFGVLDSHRADVKYEDFHGHQLDRRMLELLRQYL